MNMLKLQLNTKAEFNRDMVVEMTNQATGEKREIKPYLDGTVAARNIDAGQWRVAVKHPNILFNLYDKPIRVFKDRPTFVPIRIPPDLFENTPIRDTPEADLGPVRTRYDQAAASAEGQADKLAGQPIYADDWNLLANTMGDVSRATLDLTELVSPVGHDHPEIVEKLEEVQRNLQRFYDLFGRSLAQLQRQVQQLALQRKVDAALGEIGTVAPERQAALDAAIGEIGNAWADSPAIYSAKRRRAGQEISETMALIIADAQTPVDDNPIVIEAQNVADTIASERTTHDYASEIELQHRVDSRSSEAPFHDALRGARTTLGG